MKMTDHVVPAIIDVEATVLVDDRARCIRKHSDQDGSRIRRRTTFQTRMAVTLSAIMLAVIGTLSVLFRYYEMDIVDDPIIHVSYRRLQEGGLGARTSDTNSSEVSSTILYFGASSCGEIMKLTSPDDPMHRCAFARTCSDGEGIFLSAVFCNNEVLSTMGWCMLLSPMLLLWLVLLFRMLGSTAEDYFSPSLEMFSLKLGLPPRFAGVSLLALGNGAPDISASINAMTADPHKGYRLILGSLSGAGMFIGTIVAGSIIVATDGIICRGALMRDVMVYMLAVLIVSAEATTGSISIRSITLFFSIYVTYVILVLAADLYHRIVCVPEMKNLIETQALNEMAEQNQSAEDGGKSNGISPSMSSNSDRESVDAGPSYQKDHGAPQDRLSTDEQPIEVRPSKARSLISYFSDYRQESFRSEAPIVLRGPDGILDRHDHSHAGHHAHQAHQRRRRSSDGGFVSLVETKPLNGIDEEGDDMNDSGEISFVDAYDVNSWCSAVRRGMWELQERWVELIDDIFYCKDRKTLDKILLTCELPFTLLRKLTVTIPAEGYYCRPLVALSLALSPFWAAIYLESQMDFDVRTDGRLNYMIILVAFMFVSGAVILRYGGRESIPLWSLVPASLYGFILAATWIDYIGAHLVRLLVFFGAVCQIPDPIMGLTVLAWGNSIGDLSTNVTMARKGLANMGMTACFAGPCFTLLCGLGSGFAVLFATDPALTSLQVSLPPSVKVGFLSILCNCLLLIGNGVMVLKQRNGKITKTHAYVMFSLYGCYLAACVALQFTNVAKKNSSV